MDLITVLSYTIFGATVVTIVMAVVSYSAFKLREWRRPRSRDALPGGAGRRSPEDENLFFVKYVPPQEEPLERET